jgi:hypothetical protein
MSHSANAASSGSPLAAIGLERMDDWPKGAWIAMMIGGFIVFWPLGLAILGYMIWSGKMRGWKNSCRHAGRRHRSRPTGNTAFDAYREETLKRLEEEQHTFEEFLDRLRRAKDEKEFEDFMASRKGPAADSSASV